VSDAAHWDDRYRTTEFIWKTEPNQFLPPEVADLAPGRALDVACGEGRNAVWLATHGWDTTGIDFSDVGLTKAAGLAEANGVVVEWICSDVTTWRPQSHFDLVLVFYLQLPAQQRAAAFGVAASALAPGGTLLIVGHDLLNLAEGRGGPQNPAVLYTPDDVKVDLENSGVPDLVIDRAERRHRPIPTDTSNGNDTDTDTDTVPAIDCLVRAHRTNESS